MEKLIIKMPAVYGWQTKAKNSTVGAMLDEKGVKVVSVSGAQPGINQLLAALYASKEVREALKDFQAVEVNSCRYKIETYDKMSGSRDVFILEAQNKEGFDVIRNKFLLHVTACGKIELDRALRLSYRELIELLAWNGIADATPEELKREYEFSYLKVRETDEGFKEPTHLAL